MATCLHITGSLAAILAFACPLSHMITLMNASHLIGIAIQALHFMIMRCVPTAEQKEAGGKVTKFKIINTGTIICTIVSSCHSEYPRNMVISDVEYKRLGTEGKQE